MWSKVNISKFLLLNAFQNTHEHFRLKRIDLMKNIYFCFFVCPPLRQVLRIPFPAAFSPFHFASQSTTKPKEQNAWNPKNHLTKMKKGACGLDYDFEGFTGKAWNIGNCIFFSFSKISPKWLWWSMPWPAHIGNALNTQITFENFISRTGFIHKFNSSNMSC